MKLEPSRRMFLRGLGTALALPFLESLAPSAARADGGPLRVLYYYIPNGVYPPAWTPGGRGLAWTASPILQPVIEAGLGDAVTVVTGLRNDPANVHDNGAHFRGTASLLTARPIVQDRVQNGISADQLAANEVGDRTPFRSLALGLAPGGTSTHLCGSSWPCSYLTNISWSGETTPMGKEIRPAALFDRLFAGHDRVLSEEARARRRALDLSVLDFVREDAQRIGNRLGRTDRARMDEYLTQVRELERRIASTSPLACDAGERPEGGSYRERLAQMQDLIVLAFRCDLTRVITFMTWNGGSSDNNLGVYTWVTATMPDGTTFAVDQPKHASSHHRGDERKIAQLQAVSTWEVERFCRLVSALRATPEGDGRLLDNCLVVLTSEYGDPNTHDAVDMPCIVAGSGAGALPPRGHVALPGAKWSSFLRTILTYQGVHDPELGDSDTVLSL